MGSDPSPVRQRLRRLSASEKARTLAKLRRLETEALFSEEYDQVKLDLFRWTTAARAGHVECAEVPRMAAAFARFGIP